AGEKAINEAGGDHLVLRTSWIYGLRGHSFLKTILRLAREREELHVVDDQLGAPTWSRDLAHATARIVGQAIDERRRGQFVSGIFHVTASGAISWYGFARAILDLGLPHVKVRVPRLQAIRSNEYPAAAVRPKNSRLSNTRVAERFGVALAPWELALARC